MRELAHERQDRMIRQRRPLKHPVGENCIKITQKGTGVLAMPGDIFTGKISDPAIRIGKQTNTGKLRLRPHIEPVAGSVWNTDQVVFLAQNGKHLVAEVQVKQPLAVNEEPDFIFTILPTWSPS